MIKEAEERSMEHVDFSNRKVFRVREDVGVVPAEIDSLNFMDVEDNEFYSQMVDLFVSAGYDLERGGVPDEDNGNEIGVAGYGIDGGVMSAKEISKRSEVPMLSDFSMEEMIENDIPVVAKSLSSSRGEGKYLLETKEQKIRFAVFMLLGQNNGNIWKHKNPNKVLRNLLKRARNRDFDSRWYQGERRFQFEQYVNTPGNRDSSFRILVDGYGKIHYGKVIIARNKKGKEVLFRKPHGEYSALDEVSIPGSSLSLMIKRKDSSLYVGSRNIVSNVAQGGMGFLLNGNQVLNPKAHYTLRMLGIDPFNPIIPDHMTKMASRVGKVSKGMYPFVGVDFIRDRKGSDWFLEANAVPGLDRRGLKMSRKLSYDDMSLELVRRMIG